MAGLVLKSSIRRDRRLMVVPPSILQGIARAEPGQAATMGSEQVPLGREQGPWRRGPLRTRGTGLHPGPKAFIEPYLHLPSPHFPSCLTHCHTCDMSAPGA